MPEGILILGSDNKVEFMNVELRDVLNLDVEDDLDEEMCTNKGLHAKMFKKYSLVEELHENDKTDQHIESLISLLNSKDWGPDEDRYYELEFFGSMAIKDEDRVYTQIRKSEIEFNEKPATLLLIRNISHIINYEKSKNVGKYQELLTGTVSHEMLTPLNAIINFVEVVQQ